MDQILIVCEPILHRVGGNVPIDLLKLIVRENPAGPKRVMAATTQLAELPHAAEYFGRLLATIILPTEVHVLELLIHILTDLVPWLDKCGPLDPWASTCTIFRSLHQSCPQDSDNDRRPALILQISWGRSIWQLRHDGLPRAGRRSQLKELSGVPMGDPQWFVSAEPSSPGHLINLCGPGFLLIVVLQEVKAQ